MTLYVPKLSLRSDYFSSEDEHHMRTVVGIGSESMLEISEKYLREGDANTEEISPFVIHCIYQTAFLYIQQMRASQNEGLSKPLHVLKETLQMLRWRWRSAGEEKFLTEIFDNMNDLTSLQMFIYSF